MALNSFSSLVIFRALIRNEGLSTGMISFSVFCAAFWSSALGVSPFFTPFLPDLLGKITSFDFNCFRRSTLACRLSWHLLRRRWSTAMPMVGAIFGEILASRSSSRVKPLPKRNFMLYRCVGGCTTGLSRPAAGRGASFAALALRFWERRFLRAAWSNQVLIITRFWRPCIMPLTLRKCTLGITWLPAPVILPREVRGEAARSTRAVGPLGWTRAA